MQFADVWGVRVLPIKKGRAQCPICKETVIAKCGTKKMHHWAHEANRSQCPGDSWFEPETEWHRRWKEYFPEDWREVIVGNHRADIQLPNSCVIEVQNSMSISPEEIREREQFYGNMVWILNGAKFKKFYVWGTNERGDSIYRWKNAVTKWLSATKPVYIDGLGTANRHLEYYEYYVKGGEGEMRSASKEWFSHNDGSKSNRLFQLLWSTNDSASGGGIPGTGRWFELSDFLGWAMPQEPAVGI